MNNDMLTTMLMFGGAKGDTWFSQIFNVLLVLSIEYIKDIMKFVFKYINDFKNKQISSIQKNLDLKSNNYKYILIFKYQKPSKGQNDTGKESIFYKLSKLTDMPELYMSREYFTPSVIKTEFEIEKSIKGMIDYIRFDDENLLESCKITIMSNECNTVVLSRLIEKWFQEYEESKEYDLIQNKYIFNIYNTPIKNRFREDDSCLPNIIFNKDKFNSNKKESNMQGKIAREMFKRVFFFKNREDWYKEKGIPYQLGCLFKGLPGTGKSSMIKAMANELDRHIININFKDIKTVQQFYNLFCDEYITYSDVVSTKRMKIPINKRLYVLEEIDTLGDIVLDREYQTELPKVEPGKLTLGHILNLFDGNNEYPGRVIVITSNYAERLDRALTRGGRIDLNVEFKCPCIQEIRDYIIFFYSLTETNLELKQLEYESNLDGPMLSFADVGQILFQNDFNEIEIEKQLIKQLKEKRHANLKIQSKIETQLETQKKKIKKKKKNKKRPETLSETLSETQLETLSETLPEQLETLSETQLETLSETQLETLSETQLETKCRRCGIQMLEINKETQHYECTGCGFKLVFDITLEERLKEQLTHQKNEEILKQLEIVETQSKKELKQEPKRNLETQLETQPEQHERKPLNPYPETTIKTKWSIHPYNSNDSFYSISDDTEPLLYDDIHAPGFKV